MIETGNTIFEQEWYLNAAAPGWKELKIEEDGQLKARIPYVESKRYGRTLISTPPFMQSCGVWIQDTGGKQAKKLEFQKEQLSRIIDLLPRNADIDLYLNHKCDYCLPWIWKGFKVVPAITYRFENLSNPNDIWKGFRDKTKNEIRKAEKLLTIREDMGIEELINIENKTYIRQGRKNKMDNDALKRLDSVLQEHNARKLFCAVDSENKVHAAVYIVYDADCCHYMLGGGDPELRNSNAASLLIWEAIKFASTVSRTFDFEGSVVPEIEHFFRSFGAFPKPYWHVSRLHCLSTIREWAKPKIKRMLGYH